MTWSVTEGISTAHFQSALAPVHRSAAEAKEGKPIRLGPPFTFRPAVETEGPKALLRVDLVGPNGGRLRAARHGRKEEKILVRLLQIGRVNVEKHVEYG